MRPCIQDIWHWVRTADTQSLQFHPSILWGFPAGASVKEPACQCRLDIRDAGWKDPLEEAKTTHSSILAWRSPWTEEPGRLQSVGLHRVGQDWSALARPHAQLPHFPSLFTLSPQQTKLTFPSLTLTVLHHHSSICFSSLFSPMYLGPPCSSPSCYFFFFLATCGVLDP